MNLAHRTAYAGACLAGIGTFMLGISEDNYLLSAASVVVAIAALVLCDLKGWVQLKPWSSNVAATLALALAVWQYQTLTADARVLALADLLGYLQFVLQFKPKTTRTYWLLTVVSFLQASVASALHTGPFFALLLLAYLFSGLFFLGTFYLYREERRYGELNDKAEAASALQRHGMFARPQVVDAPAKMRGDLARRLINVGLGTIFLSAAFFAVMPRIGQTNWVPTVIVANPTVGFTPEINLERTGRLLEDPEVIMQVRFVEPETDESYQIDTELYMRGTSVSHYEQGRWRNVGVPTTMRELPDAEVLGSHDGLVSQRVTIEPLSSTTVFTCAPSFAGELLDGLRYNAAVGRIERSENLRARRFSYELLTGAFRNHRQADLIPSMMTPGTLRPYLQMPQPGPQGDPLTQLKTTAAELTADIAETDVVGRARALETYLRDSGRFQYSLDAPARPEGVDPLEDFVSANPRGHCEFFAGALTLMLRSLNIPARVVLGYRGGDFNVVGNFYQVRQLNAHSWVEIYLRPDQVPYERATTPALGEIMRRHGAWFRLEPTGGDGPQYASAGNSRWGEIQQVVDYLKFLWNNYVLGMDAVKQRDSIYRPLTEGASEVLRRLMRLGTRREWRDAIGHCLNPLNWISDDVELFSWRGGMLIGAFILAAWLIGGACYFAWLYMHRRRAALMDKRLRRPAPPVEFYVRLESMLRRLTPTRTPEQTQREFVLAACGELSESPATRGVATLPRKIVDAFYRVRFGGRPLNDVERDEVEQALSALTAVLPPSMRKGRSSKNTLA